MLVITFDLLHRFQHHAEAYLPLEVSAILIGHRDGDDDVITDFVHSVITEATEGWVANDWSDFLRRSADYYCLGHIHSHPGGWSTSPGSSEGDKTFYVWLAQQYRQRFGRKAYGITLAPKNELFSVHDEHGTLTEGLDYRIEVDGGYD